MTRPTARSKGRAVPPAPRRTWVPVTSLITAFLLGVGLAFVIGPWSSGPSETERRIAELQQAEVRRDVEQVGALIELAKGGRERLTPVLQAMATSAPPDQATVRGWRKVVAAEAQRYAETPSAGNGVNVARTGLRTAVEQLAAAVDSFEIATTATGPLQAKLLTLAETQRTAALRTWAVAALQLDVISIDAGKGHVHVYLPSGPNSGVLTPDSAPEGSGG